MMHQSVLVQSVQSILESISDLKGFDWSDYFWYKNASSIMLNGDDIVPIEPAFILSPDWSNCEAIRGGV